VISGSLSDQRRRTRSKGDERAARRRVGAPQIRRRAGLVSWAGMELFVGRGYGTPTSSEPLGPTPATWVSAVSPGTTIQRRPVRAWEAEACSWVVTWQR
jgi:hypothetical protein